MDPQLLIIVGFVTLAAGALVLLSFGPRFRIGRLLAATQRTTIAAARAAAEAGSAVYVRLDGRIDSEAEFEDADHRPLVLRRTRVQLRRGRGWVDVEDGRELVPFSLDEGLDSIGVDGDALDVGLVVVPRESSGVAGDLPDRVPPTTPPSTPARVLVEQVSSVEHAIVLGTPVRRPDGSVVMTAGTGRPLILTTLEPDEAMRVLTGGDRRRTFLAAVLLGAGLILVTAGLALGLAGSVGAGSVGAASALAAEPTATPAQGGDPRSPGEGPGFVGDPLLAVGAVVLVGGASVAATLAYVRLTERRRP